MKAGFPIKKVLVTNTSSSVGQALFRALDASSLKPIGIDFDELDWSDQGEVDALVEYHHPFLVINTFSVDPDHRLTHAGYSKHLATASTKIKARVMQLSDYHVFGAEPKNTYFETDKVSPIGDLGRELVAAEQHVVEQVEQHMIVRCSWLLQNSGLNPFTGLLRAFENGDEVAVSKDYQGAPTWLSDVVRVLVGVTQQIFSGSENWGTFHYCSGDKCSEAEFAHYLAQIYSELKPLRSQLIQVPHQDRDDLSQLPEPGSAVLSCRRIRNNFGVQARSWRQGLREHIEEWLQQNRELKPAKKSNSAEHRDGNYNSASVSDAVNN